MLPEGFDLRTQFPAGEQVKVTPAIKELSNQFRELHYPNGFQNIHDYIFGRIKIVPYDESVKAYERTRRWKLTADDLLRVGTVVDTKYCNDMVSLFLAISRGIGFDAKVAKVFNKNIAVHSLALVDSPQLTTQYVINAGSKDKYWIEPLARDTKLEFGTKLPNDWILWKADVDQWAMGLNDSSQETTTIMADAKKLLGTTA